MRPQRPAWIIAAALAVAAPRGWSQDQPPTPSAERSGAMAGLARAISVVVPGGGAKAELVADPIYRFDDPTRRYSDGTLWAFGRQGRPAALLCLSLERNERGEFWWLHELTSLSTGPVAASSRHESGGWLWNPKAAGVEFRAIREAPTPGDDEARRLRQMREIVRRFKAFETLDPSRDDPADRFALRLLPQPVHRYQDAKAGLIDGAIFLLSYGRNPEIALLIEAGRDPKSGAATWSYALAPLGAARLRVSLDDREVADIPKPPDANWKQPYCLLVRRAVDLKD